LSLKVSNANSGCSLWLSASLLKGLGHMGRWQKIYQEDRRSLTSPPSLCARRAAELFKQYRRSVILDLGCGTGRDTVYLAEAGLAVVGAEVEAAGIAKARRRCAERGFPAALLQADGRTLPFSDAAFEGVYSFGLLHEFTSMDRDYEIQRVMREIHRILQPNGLLVLAVLSGDFRFGLPDVYLFSEAMFRRSTNAFAPIEIKEYEDIGCTGKTDYRVWYGAFAKKGDSI
jgi:SAM-dependent methyltransferase